VAAVHDIRIGEYGDKLAEEVAESFIQSAREAHDRPFRVALSGGSTPRKLYGRLSSPDCATRVEWPHVEFYFSDERCVAPDHPESNFKLARDMLFQPLGIKPSQVFRIEGEAGQPDLAARRYEETIRQQFAILLGLGDDGHTASLFPGSPALNEKMRTVVASEAPRGVPYRITFTAPLINHAHMVVFMVAGAPKAPAVRAVLEDDTADANRYPAKLIQPVEGRLIWYLDRAAASALTMATHVTNSMRHT
jgi:6-phosphogluconolactonase